MKKAAGLLEKHLFLILTVPGLVLYTLFFTYPLIGGFYYSLTDWNGISKKFNFIWFNNFSDAFIDGRILNSLWFTVKYSVLLLIFTVIVSLGLALLLNRKLKMKSLIRAAYFFPAVISLITVGLVFNQLFYLAVPAIGKSLGIKVLSSNILANPDLSLYGILFVSLWQGVALPTVFFLAGLQNVPENLIEAAKIDGASKRQIFSKITFPFLIPIFNIVTILTLKQGLTVFDYIKTMTDGGPGRTTESIGLLVYNYAFKEMRYSYGITVSIILFVVIAVVSILQIKAMTKLEVEM